MPITIPSYQTDNINKKEKHKTSFFNFLESKKVSSGSVATHTSWGSKNGKYYIDDKDNKKLIKYYSAVVKYGLPGDQPITLTEKPKDISPVYVDIDFKVDKSKHSKDDGMLYDDDILENIIKLYYDGIKKYLDVEDEMMIACVFEKDGLEDKHPHWGNGIHLLFPNIITSSRIRHLIRHFVVTHSKKMNLFQKYDNPIEDIIDISVIERNNIMMFGSKKPNSMYYYNYTRCYDNNVEMIDVDSVFSKEPDVSDYIKMFSVRRSCHNKEYECIMNKNYNEASVDMEFKALGINQQSLKDYATMTVVGEDENVITEVQDLVGMLDANRAVRYEDWIRVGWCLYNIHPSLFPTFVEFSQRADEVKEGIFKGEYDIKRYWSKMRKGEGNLTISTLKYYAKMDSPIEYHKYYQEKFQKCVYASMDDGKDYQIASAFHIMYKDRFVCSNMEGHTEWWEFVEYKHRWERIPAGYRIKQILPKEFADEWLSMGKEIYAKTINATGEERKAYFKQHENITKIVKTIMSSSFRKNIMTDLATLFYDPHFNEKLDEVNKHLICFTNGVFDLEKGEFREGRPDDYISMSTGVDYIPFNPYHTESKEIKDFFEKVLPNNKVRKYFLRAVSSCLHGENRDQKLFICTGCGSNGKSVTFDLIKECLGDLFQAPRIELLTRKSNNAGQANEDLVNIKGRRMGVFQEPDNSETFNAGIMKQLTAGNDTITARRLHQSNIQFIPQMKYFLACNDLPNVKDNTDGTWRRLRVIKFISKFVNKPLEKCRLDRHEYPIDDSISKKKQDWAPYLASMLVSIYMKEYKVEGLVEPDEVKVSTNKYKSDNDHYTQFFDLFIEVTGRKKDRLLVDTIYKRMREWYFEEFMHKCPDKKNKMIEYFNNKLDQTVVSGMYRCVTFKSRDINHEDDESDDENNEVVNNLVV